MPCAVGPQVVAVEPVGSVVPVAMAIPGVVEHGIFLADLVSTVVVADPDGTIEVLGQPL